MTGINTTPPYHPELNPEDEAFLLAINLLQDRRIPASSHMERHRRETAARTLRRIWHSRPPLHLTSTTQSESDGEET